MQNPIYRIMYDKGLPLLNFMLRGGGTVQNFDVLRAKLGSFGDENLGIEYFCRIMEADGKLFATIKALALILCHFWVVFAS